MKKIIAMVMCICLAAPFAFAARAKGLTGRFVPADGLTLLFGGQANKDSDEFVKLNKKIPAGFMFYTALSDLKGLESSADFGAGTTSGSYLLKKYPGAAVQIGLYLVNSLELVIAGELDENIEKLGSWIKKANVPVFLRIGYEFDFPENNYDPEIYIKAFRYIVEKMDSLNVNNVAYVWHSYASLNPKGIDKWYPGDEYVDWCAISYFTSPQWIPMLKFSQRHNKPLMIAECAPMLNNELKESGKVKWYEKLFKFIENNNVKALCYINANWNNQAMFANYNWGNSKLNASKEIQRIWQANTQKERYITFDRLYDEIEYSFLRNALIVFCHPDNQNSANAKILKRVKKTFEEYNIKYQVRDLYSMKFNPVMSKKELQEIREKKHLKSMEKERQYVKEAEVVVFIYPIWWNNMPAILKGYVDKVFSLGLAFSIDDEKGKRNIKFKKAVVFNTMGSSEDAFAETGAGSAYKLINDDLVFGYAGFKVINHKIYGGFNDIDEKKLDSYLLDVQKVCQTISNDKRK